MRAPFPWRNGALTGSGPANLGGDTSEARNVTRMTRHRITTASLRQDIERQRAEEASSRWDELSREFMHGDAPQGSDTDSELRVR